MIARNIDWNELLRLTVENRLVPQLHRQLQALAPGSFPESFAKRLEILLNTVILHNIHLMEEMLGLLKLFETERIRALPYKGPMLATTIYDDLAMRQTRDLDILVSPKDVLRTKDLLLKRGYDPEIELNAADEKNLINHDCEYNFLKRDSRVLIEIHWRIFPPKHADGFVFEQFWDNVRRISLYGSSVPTLDHETRFLVLCLHAGQKHQWSRMRWVCDIALFVRNHWDMDWKRALRRAKQLDLTSFVGLGLYLTSALLEAEIPPAACLW